MLSASQETGEPVRTLPQRGDVLAGKYRVDRVIGDGGMCIVYAAEHLQLEDWVAVKVLRTEWVDRPEVVERFLREGKTATRIRSEHVVRTFDVGTLDDGTPCLVMEYLLGSDLDALLTANGPLPVPAAVDYLLQAGEAIGEAHQLGIVHRDLKPANLFLTHRADGSPWVKVLDFGISKLAPRAFAATGRELALTGTHSIMGSPRYMSPEQMRSSMEVDHRADIWAAGVILHELIAGQPPFDGETMPEICANILQSPAPPLTTLCPDVLPDMEAVVLRCLEKDPARRFQNLGELAAALREFGTPAGRASAHRIMGIFQSGATMYGRTSGQMPESGPAWGSTDPTWRPGPRKRRSLVRTLGIAVGSTAIVACGAITALFALHHATPTSTSAEAPTPSTVLPWENQVAPAAPPATSSAPAASTLIELPPPQPAASEAASASASADAKKAKHGSAKARGSAAPTGPSMPSSDSLSTPPRGSGAASSNAAPASSESLFEERK